ncbi:sensor histidine kinase [Cryobacterium tepidiphilum]|uniref:histidine kinase n=2 Tax=Cryobacterium tepidiphilum TaxID=2486026 RepID=A0A3M8LFL8_9MICO|nr:sensor histidine kinase [Cryobacterium tepidiphilum]
MPPGVRLWLPVVVSFLVQVPPVAVLGWHRATGSPLALLLALAGPLALIAARRFPGPVVAFTAAVAGALVLLRPDIGVPNVALAFAIVLGIVRGARLWVYASVGVAWIATLTVAAVAGVSLHPFRVAATTLFLAAMMALGEGIRGRRERISEFRRRADEQRTTAEQRERVRIARELHDVLAHSLSMINVQAGVGLHLLESQPEKAAEALGNIKDASKNALDEVRHVLGILRAEPPASGAAEGAPLTPEPDFAALPALADSFRAQGMDLTFVSALEVEGAAPASVQLALYRICQEALTNVLRHAHPRAASVYLGFDRDSYLLTVTNDGEDAVPRAVVPGGGLLGMRERAELLGGSLRVGRLADGSFQIEARIPLPVVRPSAPS